MTRPFALMIAAGALLAFPLPALVGPAAWAQTSDGVPGDRLVVPLPDVSGLSDPQAQDLSRELARMTVITGECPDHDVTDPEWQLMAGTTDALMDRLGLDAVAYDRDYVRPAFSVLEDPAACDTLGPQVPQMIARLEALGGSARPVTPGLQADTPSEAADAVANGTPAPAAEPSDP